MAIETDTGNKTLVLDDQEENERKINLTNQEHFEKFKYHLVPADKSEAEGYSLIDNIEYKKQRKGINEFITLVKKGRIRKVRVERITSEIIQIKEKINDQEVTKQWFAHVPPVHEYDSTIKTNREKIMHFAYEDEPFTRDWFSMIVADHYKKWEKLLEIGCVVRDTDLDALLKIFIIRDPDTNEELYGIDEIKKHLYKKSPTGFIFVPEWAGYDVFGKPRIVYDISDIDAIKEEIYKVLEDEVIKKYSEAVIVDPYKNKAKQLEFIIIVFIIYSLLSTGMILYFLTK